jgi:hypothetical protein
MVKLTCILLRWTSAHKMQAPCPSSSVPPQAIHQQSGSYVAPNANRALWMSPTTTRQAHQTVHTTGFHRLSTLRHTHQMHAQSASCSPPHPPSIFGFISELLTSACHLFGRPGCLYRWVSVFRQTPSFLGLVHPRQLTHPTNHQLQPSLHGCACWQPAGRV